MYISINNKRMFFSEEKEFDKYFITQKPYKILRDTYQLIDDGVIDEPGVYESVNEVESEDGPIIISYYWYMEEENEALIIDGVQHTFMEHPPFEYVELQKLREEKLNSLL